MLAFPAYDIALLTDRGQRDTQEDAIAARVFDAAKAGYVVIADGMGGHDAGEVASGLAISSWRDVLDDLLEDGTPSQNALLDALPLAAMQANINLAGHLEKQQGGFRMGTTLLGVLLLGSRLFWISIGDSPLYLFRDGRLVQINEDHSMAPVIDAQAKEGLISAEEARSHPQRNQLTSVIMGGAIPKVDCPETPLDLRPGDIVIAASDGLQYLDDGALQTILREQGENLAQDIAYALFSELVKLGDPDQDNVSIAVIKPASI
ncbi:serine/threonine protein phosphatase [Ruegeria marisrubri]|uniref:Serine/threonine protein phosphatase n=1 Tax=Ruegeria marisrubri TaxID=1685379 RepID=A0A0X3TBL7_9RHOB|nr:protein phosphatase 2C domain-containing protein [Ruegeria marisrubri]KUJ73172.1 serine/threonine protein phosphatase [Ruegeria marisrubri]